MIDPELIAILRCPVSGGKLVLDEKNARLISPEAKLAYPVRDGIAVLLKDEAVVYDETAADE
ncbi:MAG: Trm112 family protein [Gammaproteobacteria bacterium]|nr:Trm112 family protein [Pseudomonadota bacterium]MCH9663492.1 Trm112 family protein [Gammaproteobacteria bacterium]